MKPVINDWNDIATVLLDMDGTLLDLYFDNHFWQSHLPDNYALKVGLSPAQAREQLQARFDAERGKLSWYCLDFWSRELELDILELKKDIVHLIRPRPYAEVVLQWLRDTGIAVVLITNAHPDSLQLKIHRTQIDKALDRAISSHDLGYPKEE